jgi:uncharacterized protein with PQ loop repeat
MSSNNPEYLMNIASILYFICYIPEFYANWKNKNANIYNVFEKIVMLIATGFAFGYSLSINNKALLINYSPILSLDTIGLIMRLHYAWKNRNRDVRILENDQDIIENPMNKDLDTEL